MSLDMEQPTSGPDSNAATTNAAANDNASPDLEGLLDQQNPQEPEEIEEELEGLKLRGKKELVEEFKKGRMLHADYTRKTQEVAETKRTFEAEREEFQRTRQAEQQIEHAKFQLFAANTRLQQLQQAAASGQLAALRQTNPEYADQLRDELAHLAAAVPQAGAALAQQVNQRKSEAQQLEAKRANDSEAIVMREVKDWGPEKLAKFVDAGSKAGMNAEGVRQLLIQFPQASRFLNKALMYDQLLASRMQKQPTELPKPASRVGGGSASNAKPLGDITDPQEWAERRRQRKTTNR